MVYFIHLENVFGSQKGAPDDCFGFVHPMSFGWLVAVKCNTTMVFFVGRAGHFVNFWKGTQRLSTTHPSLIPLGRRDFQEKSVTLSLPSFVANLLHCPPAASCVLYKASKWECCLILNISSLFDHFIVSHIELSTVETAYKVYVCPRGNLLYMQIYLITHLKLLQRGIFGLLFIYFISDFTL